MTWKLTEILTRAQTRAASEDGVVWVLWIIGAGIASGTFAGMWAGHRGR